LGKSSRQKVILDKKERKTVYFVSYVMLQLKKYARSMILKVEGLKDVSKKVPSWLGLLE